MSNRVPFRCERGLHGEGEEDGTILVLCGKCTAHARVTGRWQEREWDGCAVYHRWRWTGETWERVDEDNSRRDLVA